MEQENNIQGIDIMALSRFLKEKFNCPFCKANHHDFKFVLKFKPLDQRMMFVDYECSECGKKTQLLFSSTVGLQNKDQLSFNDVRKIDVLLQGENTVEKFLNQKT